jgi:hypothetical protein
VAGGGDPGAALAALGGALSAAHPATAYRSLNTVFTIAKLLVSPVAAELRQNLKNRLNVIICCGPYCV